jgi:nucleoside-diphosphate kinase
MGPWPKIRESPCSSPTNVNAKLRGPQTIRAIYGIDGMRNAVHGSDSVEAAQKEIEIFFGANNAMKTHCDIKDTTLCIIKPHILTDNLSGKIIDDIIKSGFKIIAAEMFPLSY